MARRSNLVRREGGTYYARIYYPIDLRDLFKSEDKKVSLRTKDEAIAKQRLYVELAKWEAHFADLRARRLLTADDKTDAAWQHYNAILDRYERTRTKKPNQEEIDAEVEKAVERMQRENIDPRKHPLAALDIGLDVLLLKGQREFDSFTREAKLKALQQHLGEGEPALINHAVEDYIERNKLLVDDLSPDRGELAQKMMRGEIEALKRSLERDRGDYTGKPDDPAIKPPIGAARETAKAGETVLEIFEQYARENPKGITADTISQARRDIGTFVDCAGSGLPVQRIDKKAVREWKALLMQYPVKATETKEFAGMKMPAIVRHNEKVGKPIITPRTVNRYLSSLGAFCDWLVTHGYLDQNPVTGMALAKDKKLKGVVFTPEQLTTLFRSPLFTGCQSADEWRNVAKAGNVRIRDHRYWLPLVMLFSGARPAEIAQLAIADVRQEHGQWIMHITEEGEGDKSVKTAGSMRVVPIHDELIKLGFLKHRQEMQDAGHTRLFPEAKRNSRGQMVAEFSREFGRYLARLGMKDGRGLSLYSFRHGATDALRRAGHLDEQFGYILGHTSATMTGRYGQLPQGMLAQRVELINSIAYPGLDLKHLM